MCPHVRSEVFHIVLKPQIGPIISDVIHWKNQLMQKTKGNRQRSTTVAYICIVLHEWGPKSPLVKNNANVCCRVNLCIYYISLWSKNGYGIQPHCMPWGGGGDIQTSETHSHESGAGPILGVLEHWAIVEVTQSWLGHSKKTTCFSSPCASQKSCFKDFFCKIWKIHHNYDKMWDYLVSN